MAIFPCASLYVGDLDLEVSEAQLYEVFNTIASVASIRVCRDAQSRRSLGYAYVNYHTVQDAEQALAALNFKPLRGRNMRIMWCQRDPCTRRTNSNNLFVKNLDRTIDSKALHETFSMFGRILSCKVATDHEGRSLGYGFVHFAEESVAQVALKRMNGVRIGALDVVVCEFVCASDRRSFKERSFTNLYVSNFPKQWSVEILREVFGVYGAIADSVVKQDVVGRPYGFVNFKEHGEAKAAMEGLNGARVTTDGVLHEKRASGGTDSTLDKTDAGDDCMELKVARYLSRVERAAMCKTRTVEYPQKPPRSDGNLYVKNLAHDVDDSSLRELFSSCGTVVNARVVREPTGGSRGFGFVSLSSHEEATRAIAEFNSKVVKGKAIFVNYAENKKRVQRVPYGVPPPVYYRNPVWGQYPAFPSYGELPYPQAGPFYPPTQYDSGVDMAELNQELNDAPAASHKQLIGERLYPVVQRYDPQFAGKITGMMLEMSKPELMNIMQSEQSISLKVGEAKAVLQRAQTARRR